MWSSYFSLKYFLFSQMLQWFWTLLMCCMLHQSVQSCAVWFYVMCCAILEQQCAKHWTFFYQSKTLYKILNWSVHKNKTLCKRLNWFVHQSKWLYKHCANIERVWTSEQIIVQNIVQNIVKTLNWVEHQSKRLCKTLCKTLNWAEHQSKTMQWSLLCCVLGRGF